MKEIIAELSPFVFPYLPGRIAQGLVDNEMWQTCQDFCRVTQGWKEEIILNLKENQSDYNFVELLDGDGEFERIFEVVILSSPGFTGTPSPGVPADNNPYTDSIYNTEGVGYTIACNGFDYSMGLDDQEVVFLHLNAAPTQDIQDGLRITSVLKPTRESMQIPDLIAEYKYYLAAGVRARFNRMVHLPTGDLNQAMENERIYHEGLAKLRTRLNQNMTSQEPYVTYPEGY